MLLYNGIMSIKRQIPILGSLIREYSIKSKSWMENSAENPTQDWKIHTEISLDAMYLLSRVRRSIL